MSAVGEGKDAFASRAKPRLEERVCEHGRHPTLAFRSGASLSRRAHGSAHRRTIAQEADTRCRALRRRYEEAKA